MKNIQGDIIGIVDESGRLVVEYTYDEWGKSIKTRARDSSGELVESAAGDTVFDANLALANANPFRYRGYYFDESSGFYYCQSRYYDPGTGRFINADGQLNMDSLLGTNMFSYCENNPVNYDDPDGRNPVLSRGSRGFWVKELQVILNTAGGYGLAVDGSFGPLTRNAVIAYQTANGLKVDGIVGPQTWGSLNNRFDVILRQKNGQPFSDLPRDPKVLDDMYKNTPPGAQRNKIKEQQKRVGARKNSQTKKPNKIVIDPPPVVVPAPSGNWYDPITDFFDSLFGGCRGGLDSFGNPITCFTSDTLIKTDKGLKPISDIQIGDMVFAYNDVSGEMAYKRVCKTFSNTSYEMVHIKIDGEVIKATLEHPFYINDVGWVPAKEVKAGVQVKLASGKTSTVESIQSYYLESPCPVYNFEVEDYHTYFVSEIEVLVHNRCR